MSTAIKLVLDTNMTHQQKRRRKEAIGDSFLDDYTWKFILSLLELDNQISLSTTSQRFRNLFLSLEESFPLKIFIQVKHSMRSHKSTKEKLSWLQTVSTPIDNEIHRL